MKLIEDLYNLYRNKLTGDEEDIDMLAFAVLEQLNRKEILDLLHEMDDQELNNLMGIYIIESLKGKFAQESLEETKPSPFHHRNIH
ncbi:hypothetical protein ELQ35_02865 [Peribacillus cavernae]|uniref:Cytosolic protein n=1 Tax=Peribacillus cavernae TaxID=1674310 RepID=A0A3S1BB18_9BACI|nr:DUF6154 family protein [Peribacillus cavernae]MDQ0220270.1 hypothetical protein [Peribacillus cavernae]RUQ31932.1 hypothetical protein ELQ35_02865 [Peribacillus cavernae]